jgi:hypothetical protein
MIERDPLLVEAARIVVRHRQGTTSALQRELKIGYDRAARLIDELAAVGVLRPPDGSKPREVFVSIDEVERYLATSLPPTDTAEISPEAEESNFHDFEYDGPAGRVAAPSPFSRPRMRRTRSMVERLRSVGRRDVAEDAIREVLAGQRPSDVKPSAVENALSEGGISGREREELLVDLWRETLTSLLGQNGQLDDASLTYLKELQQLLGISERSIATVRMEVIV